MNYIFSWLQLIMTTVRLWMVVTVMIVSVLPTWSWWVDVDPVRMKIVMESLIKLNAAASNILDGLSLFMRSEYLQNDLIIVFMLPTIIFILA